MNIELATIQEYESIIAFYDDVTARTPEIATYARWQKDKHPTAEGIRAYIDEGSMYLYRNNGKIVGAMAVRLDALASNTPAHKLYERLGFEYRGKQHLYAENTGWTDFFFFDYALVTRH